AMFAGRLGDPGAVPRIAAAASAALDRLPESARPVDALLRGIVARITGGVSAGAAPLRLAMDLMQEQARNNDHRVARWMVPAFPIMQETAALELWDETVVHHLASVVVRRA